ncbi:hypothetical protein GGI07_000393 [Coemansia sp. Benny D115]|nr:hypothetical protein GGI07_000393 [Coemansia sp. Benny D115]
MTSENVNKFTDAHMEMFARDGYVVIEDYLDADKITAMRARIGALLDQFDPQSHHLTTFETGTNEDRHVGNRYYLDSGVEISYFLDEDAVVDGKLVTSPQKAVNKIGHGLHMKDELFASVTHDEEIRRIVQKMGYEDPRVLQSMAIFKQPKIGGAVPWHQDSTFLFTKPLSAFGFWYALEDCTLTNGCLEAVPGSHRYTPVTRRFVIANADDEYNTKSNPDASVNSVDGQAATKGSLGTKMVDIDPVFSLFPPNRDGGEAKAIAAPETPTESAPLEVKAGSLVLLHGQLLHRSSHNYSDKSRWIYTFHVIEGAYEYDEHNWLQMPEGVELTKL